MSAEGQNGNGTSSQRALGKMIEHLVENKVGIFWYRATIGVTSILVTALVGLITSAVWQQGRDMTALSTDVTALTTSFDKIGPKIDAAHDAVITDGDHVADLDRRMGDLSGRTTWLENAMTNVQKDMSVMKCRVMNRC